VDGTRERLLDAAERLFAQQGYGASLRDITGAAEANLAAVNYHFGCKEELLVAVVLRRIEDANRRRLDALDALEVDAGFSLEGVIEVFLRPCIEWAGDEEGGGALFMRLIGRVHGDPDGPWQRILASGVFDQIQRRFLASFARACPDLSQEDLLWRLHLLVGSMIHTFVNPDVLVAMSGGSCDPRDPERALAQLVPFLAAGFRAPKP